MVMSEKAKENRKEVVCAPDRDPNASLSPSLTGLRGPRGGGGGGRGGERGEEEEEEEEEEREKQGPRRHDGPGWVQKTF